MMKTELTKQTANQEGPGRTQDSGDMTPSVWGKNEFKVGQAPPESKTIKTGNSVDLVSGKHSC